LLYGDNYFCNKNDAKLQICSPLFQLSSQQSTCSNVNNAALVRFIAGANLIEKGGDYNCNHTFVIFGALSGAVNCNYTTNNNMREGFQCKKFSYPVVTVHECCRISAC